MDDTRIVVEGFLVPPADHTDLRDEVWSFALDQRAFGPRRLVVAFADPSGRLVSLAHAPRTDPPEAALEACIRHLGGEAAAVAFCDDQVGEGPPPPDLETRFAAARSVAADYAVHLVDWIACDDSSFLSSRLSLDPYAEWWDVPATTWPPPSLRVPRRRARSEPRWVPRHPVRWRR
jgi:hypothetical protein